MELKPLNNYIIAQKIKEGEKIIGGIIIPESVYEKKVQRNLVTSVSPQCQQVIPGDVVIARNGAGTCFTLEDQEYIAFDEIRDLICKIKE